MGRSWLRRLSVLIPALGLGAGAASAGGELRLEVMLAPDYAPKLVATSPDAATIASAVRRLRWNEIAFVVLSTGDAAGIELSGSLRPEDGLSARYWEAGREYVSARPPANVREGIALLQSYAAGGDAWRSKIEWE